MSDTQVAAQSAQPTSLTIAQAAQMYAESKVTGQPNPVSDAARTLGQQAAKAREERRAEAANAVQNPPVEEGGNVEDDQTQTGEAQDDLPAENADTPTAENPDDQGDPDTRTIDLGDGVALPVAEVREMIMLKADHTRRLQALSEDRKQLDSDRSQKLTQLDTIVSNLEQKVGKPKSLKELINEHGPIDAMEKYAEQEEETGRLEAAKGIARRQRQEHLTAQIKDRDRQLAETYNKEWADEARRDAAFTELSEFALKRGADPEHLRQLTEPWMIEVLDLAMKQVKTAAGAKQITKAVLEKPKVIKPGTKLSAGAANLSKVQQAQKQLKSSGSIADAVALLQARRGSRG